MDLARVRRDDSARFHALFTLEPVGLFVADPLDDVVEVAHQTDVLAHVLDVDLDPERDVFLTRIEVGVVERAVGDQNLVVAEDLSESCSPRWGASRCG